MTIFDVILSDDTMLQLPRIDLLSLLRLLLLLITNISTTTTRTMMGVI